VRDRDLGQAQSATHKVPFACPVCGARLVPWLIGNPVIRFIAWIIGEFVVYIVAILLLLGFFVLPWWAAFIPLILAICDVISRVWPLARVGDK
jgi:hypothetical protein